MKLNQEPLKITPKTIKKTLHQGMQGFGWIHYSGEFSYIFYSCSRNISLTRKSIALHKEWGNINQV
jgi:hypothetical protein